MSVSARVTEALRRRGELFGINRRNVELVYANNERHDYPIADDKLVFKGLMEGAAIPVPETLCVCEGLFAIAPALATLSEQDQFVVKPANGAGGQGILVVGARLERGRWLRAGGAALDSHELRRHLAHIVFGTYSNELEDRAFVERRVVPHDVFQALWADGLCDVRIITLRATPVIAMLRVPTRESEGRANLHQGGLGIAVDLDTGRTVRAVQRGRAIQHHPDSGVPLVGVELPSWAEILDVARRVAGAVPLGYLGVDIVVDRDRGPLALEINARPGLEIQNVHGLGLKVALRRAAP